MISMFWECKRIIALKETIIIEVIQISKLSTWLMKTDRDCPLLSRKLKPEPWARFKRSVNRQLESYQTR